MMQADRTLTLDLGNVLDESRQLAASIKPGRERWDAIVVGSGAAGGMAAFQLATAGIKVLLLEAGRMIDTRTEYRTMEWPYASMRRGRRVQLSRSPVRRQQGVRKIEARHVVLRQHVHAQLGRGRARASDHRHAV